MDFQITEEHVHLQQRCRQLAEDFVARAALHGRTRSGRIRGLLRQAGFYALNVPKELGGWGMGLLGYALAAEELAQGCPATALAFNMHPCMVGPLMENPLVTVDAKQRLARLVVQDQQLLAGNLSEPTTSALLGTYTPTARARRVDGGYRITGRKAFASMIEAADSCIVVVHPDEATEATAGMLLLVPRSAVGRRVTRSGIPSVCGRPAVTP